MDLRKLYKQGKTFEKFLQEGKERDVKRLMEIYGSIKTDGQTEEKIKNIDKNIKVVVFAEMWCPDCIVNLPVLKKIADLSDKVEFRILPREIDLMERYRVDGRAKIPTFVFLDENYNELGCFVEMPEKVRKDILESDELKAAEIIKRHRKGEFIQEALDEILNICCGQRTEKSRAGTSMEF